MSMVGTIPEREAGQGKATKYNRSHGEKGFIASVFSTTGCIPGFLRFRASLPQPAVKHRRPRQRNQSRTVFTRSKKEKGRRLR
jgi:hypothetical protein